MAIVKRWVIIRLVEMLHPGMLSPGIHGTGRFVQDHQLRLAQEGEQVFPKKQLAVNMILYRTDGMRFKRGSRRGLRDRKRN